MGNFLDDFLNSGNRGSSDFVKFLKNWRNRQTPEIYTWMHTRIPPQSIWQHSFPRVKVWTDKDTKETRRQIWNEKFVSHESPRVMNSQYFRDSDTGARRVPPERCPFSFLLEYVRELIVNQELDWLTPLFRFEVVDNDPKEKEPVTRVKVIHAGGFVGMFNDKMTEEQRVELRRAGIKLNDPNNKGDSAWMQNAWAKQSYVFPIVDNGSPDAGVQITVESKLIYSKVCDVIMKYREEFTDPQTKQITSEAYDPFKHPYCIKWSHHPNAKGGFNDTYNAAKISNIACTAQIEELIYGDPPDLSAITTPFDPRLMRSIFESSCQVTGIPWDDIFSSFAEKPDDPQLPAGPARAPELPAASVRVPEVASDDDVCPECGPNKNCPHVACDKCDMPILETDAVCKHCKHVYQVVPVPQGEPTAATNADADINF